jgi:hypothetical protein
MFLLISWTFKVICDSLCKVVAHFNWNLVWPLSTYGGTCSQSENELGCKSAWSEFFFLPWCQFLFLQILKCQASWYLLTLGL